MLHNVARESKDIGNIRSSDQIGSYAEIQSSNNVWLKKSVTHLLVYTEENI